jgi:hypothetical protein
MDSNGVACLPDKEGSSIFEKANRLCNKWRNSRFPRFSIVILGIGENAYE